MNEEELQQARLNDAAGRAHAHVSEWCRGRTLDRATISGARDVLQAHIDNARKRDGIPFPDMDVIGFERIGAIEIVRRDWEPQAIKTWLVNCTVKYPSVTALELAQAVKAAWPDFSVDKHDLSPPRRRR